MKDEPSKNSLPRRTLLKGSAAVVFGAPLVVGCKATLPTEVVTAGVASSVPLDTPQQLPGYDIFLLRSDAGVAAVSGRCTHRSCAVRVDAEGGAFKCRCHGSVFAFDGTLREGPADEDLAWYRVRIEEGVLQVDPGEIVPKGTWAPLA